MKSSGKPRKSTDPNQSDAGSRSQTWSVGGPTDNMSSTHRRRTMARVKGRDTGPEIVVRRIAHRLGFRFRLYCRDLPGCPDLVFRRLQRVIFVHGCFWHSHSCKKGCSRPVNNAAQWQAKLEANVVRDRAALRQLRADGWHILVLWECQLKNLPRLTMRISRFLQSRRACHL
jgi:DNA mismatch endonuclease (patch repair protein)